MSLREWMTQHAAGAPPLTSAELEAMLTDLWESVDPAAANTIVMRRDTFVMLRSAYRDGVKRRRRQRMMRPRSGLLPRGSQVREREGKFERYERRYGRRW